MVVDVSDGSILQRMDYDAWGKASLVAGSWDEQPFGFAGGLFDPDTGLVRFGARDYDADVGRWTTKDPIRFGGGQNNLYAYVGSLPNDFVDPHGYFACGGLCLAAVGMGLNVAAEIAAQVIGDNVTSVSGLDGTNLAIAAVLGAVGGGIGYGISEQVATNGMRLLIGMIVGAELNVVELIAQEEVNNRQGQNPNGTTWKELARAPVTGAMGELLEPAAKGVLKACGK